MKEVAMSFLKNVILGFVLLVGIDSSSAFASHFRFGHIHWEAEEMLTVRFRFVSAFARSSYSGSGTDGYPVTGDLFLESVGETRLCFGEREESCTGTLYFKVIAYDPAADWVIGVATESPDKEGLTYTYRSNGVYAVESKSCCRISAVSAPNAHLNNPDGHYRITTKVVLPIP
jgi:hypothetical protein